MYGVQASGDWMDEFGPLGVISPKMTSAVSAEMSFVLTPNELSRPLERGPVHFHVLPPLDGESARVRARIDTVPSAARRLDANGTITSHVWNGMSALCSVFHRPAGARAEYLHAVISPRGAPPCNRILSESASCGDNAPTESLYQRQVTRNDQEGATRSLRAATATEPLAAIARVVAGNGGGGRSLKLGPGSYVIGASGDCDLVVEDAAVSRAHLKVKLAAEGVVVEDLGSRNGTYFLGQKVGKLTLSLGSRVRLGETEIEFVPDREDFEGTQGAAVDHYGELHGKSSGMLRLFTLMKRLEGSLVSVLIHGESGTGKELIARAIHQHSPVSNGPFVALNCGALDRALVRSELFGHKKGAFTGALGENSGAFAEADGGTLFLDEIGELPLDIQPVLLRVLESGTYSRVGETRPRPVKVRVIAATHRSLDEDVEDGLFRSDLYYRLMVVSLYAPPLRERPEDIPLLVQRMSAALGLTDPGQNIINELSRRAFPGNVRELKHALMAYQAVGELPEGIRGKSGDQLDSALHAFLDLERPYSEQKEALIDRMTRLYLKALMEKTGGNRSEAARIAELQRGYVRRLLEKYGLD